MRLFKAWAENSGKVGSPVVLRNGSWGRFDGKVGKERLRLSRDLVNMKNDEWLFRRLEGEGLSDGTVMFRDGDQAVFADEE